MKNLIQSLACVCFGLSLATVSFGADTPNERKLSAEELKAAHSDHIALKEGKTWVMKNGTKIQLTGPATLLDGTTVQPDGSLTLANGQKGALKEGEAITWAGKVQEHDKLMKDIQQKKVQEDTQRAAGRN